jgi:cell division control protein 6
MSLQHSFESEFSKPTVFKDRNKIMPHYTPNNLPFRKGQQDAIISVVGKTTRGLRPDNLFIYGRPGTGKTSTTRHVMDELCQFAAQKSLKIRYVYINCRTHNKKYKVLLKGLKELFPESPDKAFQGYSAAYLYEKLVGFVRDTETHLILVLDELDKVRDLDELIYSLTRSNDELPKGGISVIGISNNLSFKDALDPRTKSSLCQHEMIFPPYDAEQLLKILTERVEEAFFPSMVEYSAISRSAQLAAQESGDARTALKLMLKAGELADREGASLVKEDHVNRGKSDVEKDMMIEHISSRPEQEKILLYTMASMELKGSTTRNLYGETTGRLMSGDIYEEYQKVHSKVKLKDEDKPVTDRQVREYMNSEEMDGLISIVPSGVGVKGQTRFIKLKVDPALVKEVLEKEFFG